jgi:hypothetical protein
MHKQKRVGHRRRRHNNNNKLHSNTEKSLTITVFFFEYNLIQCSCLLHRDFMQVKYVTYCDLHNSTYCCVLYIIAMFHTRFMLFYFISYIRHIVICFITPADTPLKNPDRIQSTHPHTGDTSSTAADRHTFTHQFRTSCC